MEVPDPHLWEDRTDPRVGDSVDQDEPAPGDPSLRLYSLPSWPTEDTSGVGTRRVIGGCGAPPLPASREGVHRTGTQSWRVPSSPDLRRDLDTHTSTLQYRLRLRSPRKSPLSSPLGTLYLTPPSLLLNPSPALPTPWHSL